MSYRHIDKWILCLPLLFTLTLITACRGSKETGTVSGTVTVDGQIVEKGSIVFLPVDGSGPSSGASIEDGKYSAEVWPAKSKVSIYVPKAVGSEKMSADMPDSEARVVMAESLPPKFNSKTELEMDVQLGQNDKDWELSIKNQ